MALSRQRLSLIGFSGDMLSSPLLVMLRKEITYCTISIQFSNMFTHLSSLIGSTVFLLTAEAAAAVIRLIFQPLKYDSPIDICTAFINRFVQRLK